MRRRVWVARTPGESGDRLETPKVLKAFKLCQFLYSSPLRMGGGRSVTLGPP